MYTFSIPYLIPSQNTRDGQHWSVRGRDTKKCESLIRVYAKGIPHAKGPRKLTLVSYRPRTCDDDANLRGGAKGAIDAIVRAGLLIDDKDKTATINYEQHALSKMPPDVAEKWSGRPCTLFVLEEI